MVIKVISKILQGESIISFNDSSVPNYSLNLLANFKYATNNHC